MPDPATALAEHKARCRVCRAEMTRPGAPLCGERTELTRLWRAWLREGTPEPAQTAARREGDDRG